MTPVLWLASYPRSGNTMLRIILAQCFGLPSAAIYPEDLGGNAALQQLTGRIGPDAAGALHFGDAPIRVLKTHGPPQDGNKAIYIVRNGVDAVASFHDHGGRKVPLDTLIHGRPGLPPWSGHVGWWLPRARPHTLLLRYEDVVADIPGTIDRVAAFTGLAPTARSIPSRDALARLDGKWIRSAEAPDRTRLSADQIEQFWAVNKQTMLEYGYDKRH